MPEMSGKCLCGAVRFVLNDAKPNVGVCHCKMCRRWGGGLPQTAVGAKVELQDSADLRWWRSSDWGERGFCAICGSSLFWRMTGGGDWQVCVGALDDESALSIAEHIFIDDKPGFYDFADAAPRLTGAQFTARVFSGLPARDGDDLLRDALAKITVAQGEPFAAEVKRLMDAAPQPERRN